MQVRTILLTACLILALLFGPSVIQAQYQVTNLVSNQEKTARVTDPLLVNAWGLVHPPGGPFWISGNNSGWSTLYTSNGTKVPLNVFIPTAGGDDEVRLDLAVFKQIGFNRNALVHVEFSIVLKRKRNSIPVF